MRSVIIKGLLTRKLRAALTALAVVLGVAMVSGTYVLTDTVRAGFNSIYDHAYASSDAIITGRSSLDPSGTDPAATDTPAFDAKLLDKVKALPDVGSASGSIADSAQLVDRNGKLVGRAGAAALALGVAADGHEASSLQIVSGRFPTGEDEVAVDQHTASRDHFAIGAEVGVVGGGPIKRYRITGTLRFAGVGSIGGASIVVFELHAAQRFFGKEGKLDSISVAAKRGVAPGQIVRELKPLLPANAGVRTGSQEAASASEASSRFTTIFQRLLLAFGGVALFVGAFVIVNTLSVIVAQRTREFATLRTLGATKRQLLRAVLAEGAIIGAVASAAGIGLGVGLAKLLDRLFAAAGVDLPKAGTIVATRTIVVSVAVGIGVTVIASVVPAVRATRIPPIAAVREGPVQLAGRRGRARTPLALLAVAAGLGLVVLGLFDDSFPRGIRFASTGFGVAVTFVAAAVAAPALVSPLAAVLGAPGSRLGVTGRLARDNARRNPTRTASTAAALMIGLALVTFVAVLASGLKSDFESAVDQLFRTDYAITSPDGFTPIGADAGKAVRRVLVSRLSHRCAADRAGHSAS